MKGTHTKMPLTKAPRILNPGGFSLIELITVIAGLAMLTSIAATTLGNIFDDLENDEVEAHLNSLAAECLKIQANMADSQATMQAPTSINRNLIDKSSPEDPSIAYKEKDNNSCAYFQINPKDSRSETNFSMGFGITYGKVTKFAIVDEASNLDDNEETDIEIACKLWAGEGNCLANGSDYSLFFTHMDDVRKARATCNISLRTYMASTPNPTDGGNQTTWDSEADKDCRNKSLPANANSYSTANCKTGGCTKDVKIKDGKIVGVGINAEDEYEQYLESGMREECNTKISEYLENDYTNPEEKEFAECKDGNDELIKFYFCDKSQMNKDSYDKCRLDIDLNICVNSLDTIRTSENGPHMVGGRGLPPCGQTVWACNSVIYDTAEKYNIACPS